MSLFSILFAIHYLVVLNILLELNSQINSRDLNQEVNSFSETSKEQDFNATSSFDQFRNTKILLEKNPDLIQEIPCMIACIRIGNM